MVIACLVLSARHVRPGLAWARYAAALQPDGLVDFIGRCRRVSEARSCVYFLHASSRGRRTIWPMSCFRSVGFLLTNRSTMVRTSAVDSRPDTHLTI